MQHLCPRPMMHGGGSVGSGLHTQGAGRNSSLSGSQSVAELSRQRLKLERARKIDVGVDSDREQLTEFYRAVDPNRAADIDEHVDRLLSSYPIATIARSLIYKYGAVPKGWESYQFPARGGSVDQSQYSVRQRGQVRPQSATPESSMRRPTPQKSQQRSARPASASSSRPRSNESIRLDGEREVFMGSDDRSAFAIKRTRPEKEKVTRAIKVTMPSQPVMLPSGESHQEDVSSAELSADQLQAELREEVQGLQSQLRQVQRREAEQDNVLKEMRQELEEAQRLLLVRRQLEQDKQEQQQPSQQQAWQTGSWRPPGQTTGEIVLGLKTQISKLQEEKRSLEQQLWDTKQQLGSEEELRAEVEELIKENRRLRQTVVSHDLNLAAEAEKIANNNASLPSPELAKAVRRMRRMKKGVRRKVKIPVDETIPKQAAKRKAKEDKAKEAEKQREGMVEARSRIAALELQAKQSKAALEGVQKANQELKTRLFGLTKDSNRQRFKGSSPRIQEAQRQINLLTGGNAPPL